MQDDTEERNSGRDSSKLSDQCKNISVSEIMSRDPVSFREDDTIEGIIKVMLEYPYHIYPVVDKRRNLVGTIDPGNVLEFLFFERIPRNNHTHLMAVRSLSETAENLMVDHPLTVDEKTDLCDVADLMMKHHLERICVVNGQKLQGVVSKLDLIKKIFSLRSN
ncbi:MAG: signal transduction protein with CBS domain [Methanolobus sp. T82-4]|nr:MAG: signal transduction protein with CBS domain [Methanolobus sp. T82-4]